MTCFKPLHAAWRHEQQACMLLPVLHSNSTRSSVRVSSFPQCRHTTPIASSATMSADSAAYFSRVGTSRPATPGAVRAKSNPGCQHLCRRPRTASASNHPPWKSLSYDASPFLILTGEESWARWCSRLCGVRPRQGPAQTANETSAPLAAHHL